MEDESERFRTMTIAALFYSAVFAFKYMMKNMMQKRVILLKIKAFRVVCDSKKLYNPVFDTKKKK